MKFSTFPSLSLLLPPLLSRAGRVRVRVQVQDPRVLSNQAQDRVPVQVPHRGPVAQASSAAAAQALAARSLVPVQAARLAEDPRSPSASTPLSWFGGGSSKSDSSFSSPGADSRSPNSSGAGSSKSGGFGANTLGSGSSGSSSGSSGPKPPQFRTSGSTSPDPQSQQRADPNGSKAPGFGFGVNILGRDSKPPSKPAGSPADISGQVRTSGSMTPGSSKEQRANPNNGKSTGGGVGVNTLNRGQRPGSVPLNTHGQHAPAVIVVPNGGTTHQYHYASPDQPYNGIG
ncbi:MAG: hypothetical protein M1816_003984 [Peltula sp. TS41687]|nr:MAG: hypothetical protein M1816_003984 [Peltula sp. TS41687]